MGSAEWARSQEGLEEEEHVLFVEVTVDDDRRYRTMNRKTAHWQEDMEMCERFIFCLPVILLHLIALHVFHQPLR